MKLAPVALFVYNRPAHLRQAVESLLRDPLARSSELHVFSDGPKSPAAMGAVRQVRDYVRGLDGFKSVTLHERESNFGLAKSLIDGITRICDNHGRVVVLEDDIVVSPYFLDYMNAALNHYADSASVMHVSGYMFPVENAASLPETFFYRAASCWGWGTWARAWALFEPDAERLLKRIMAERRERDFDILESMHYTRMLKEQTRGEIDSWAIRWYASVFLHGGLCLHPAISLTRNIGHDSSGTHCDFSSVYETPMAQGRVRGFPDDIVESRAALEAMMNFYRAVRDPFYARLLRRLAGLLGRGKHAE